MSKQTGIIAKTNSIFKFWAKVFSRREKFIVAIFLLIAIISGSIFLYNRYFFNTYLTANYGGVYREGIISQKSSDLNDTTNRLTKIGLIKFDKEGKIVPEVASSWEISSDVREYIFTIDDRFNRDDVLAQLRKQKEKFSQITIEPQDEKKIKFSFPQSYSPFLAESTEPMLEYGPYKLIKESSSQLDFEANSDFYLGKPYIKKIILRVYPDQENLTKAFEAREIDGVFNSLEKDWKGYTQYQFKLPRYNLIFFNTTREVLKNSQTRQKIAKGEKFDNELKLLLVSLDSSKYRKMVEEVISQWHDQNIKVDVYYKSASELTNDIIPKRDYDILVYGLDYGRDPDPYPFWHSSQATDVGYNLSGFSNIDADKALEDARKTIDQEKRNKAYEDFWKYFSEEVPAEVLSQDEWQFLVSEKVKGIETSYSITPADRYSGVEKWYIKTKRVNK